MIKLEHSVEIDAPAREAFAQLSKCLTDVAAYLSWHPDHAGLRWSKGKPLQEGSVLVAEEYLHGRLHRLAFRVTKIVPNESIQYRPLLPFSILATAHRFGFETLGEDRCRFVADGGIRFPRWLTGRMDEGNTGRLAAARRHMREEGENLKRAVETRPSRPGDGSESRR